MLSQHVSLLGDGHKLTIVDSILQMKTCCVGDAQVAQLWKDAARLAEVGQAAVQKARSWTELANASVLMTLVDDILESSI